MAVASAPAFEITVELDPDRTPNVGQPQIQSADESAQKRDKPRLPFLEQIEPSNTHNLDTPSSGSRGTELLTGGIRRGGSRRTQKASTDLINSPGTPRTENDGKLGDGQDYIKYGKLLKTSRVRMAGEVSGPVKQKRFRLRTEQRWFRLTEEALEYYQQSNHLTQVKVRHSYPLTSIEEVVYNDDEPNVFHLLFPENEMVLESETEQDAKEWVEKIKDAWSQWHMEVEMSFDDQEPTQPSSDTPADNTLGIPEPSFPAVPPGVSPPSAESKAALARLHDNYAMVKYPRTALGIPHERVFQVDKDNLQVLWRSTISSKFRQKSSLRLHKVVEVREGQLTDSFAKFPYDEVKSQSFSFIFEEERKKYVKLTSIDLICDHPNNYDFWIEGLRSLVAGTNCSMFPHRYETTDPVILWLKQIWGCKCSHHEMNLKKSIGLVKKIQPNISKDEAKELIKVSHAHQFSHTLSHGVALRWDGFTLLFNLLCYSSTSRLYTIFQEYAKKYPALGMTQEEFKNFVVGECHWDLEEASDSQLQTLMKHHDFHHRAFKKYVAKNRPKQYQICTKLLSYAGFLSFLRSRDNSAIDLEHESVYQDMKQPLSHYFINSSHNTYLEADQLRGKSSLDAYVRALLQGCRCVEIDCWDDTFNVTGLTNKEPVIYHGYTLTSKIPFREVIHTINDYSFRTSLYPIIISIENHCSEDQQSKMAKIFRAIMGEVLPSENLVELEGRERLPSPLELQGKIILKGSFKGEIKGAGTTPRPQRTSTQVSLNTPQSTPISPGSHSTGRSVSITSGTSQDEDQGVPGSPTPLSPTERSRTRTHSFIFNRGSEIRRSLLDRVKEQEKGQDDQELVFEQTSKDLKKLIVYCRSVSIKPWSWRKQQETSVSDMFSFGEPSAVRHCGRSPRDILRCTERQLVRTYPKGTRFDSSNYDPMQMWNCGIQMVALNYQKPDLFMHLNQGFFRRNGGCGYVLKPAVMRREDPGGERGGSAPYSPAMEVPHREVPSVKFEIELLSGQRLCHWNRKFGYVTVDIHTYGIPHDNGKMTQANTTHPLWPQWEDGEFKLSKNILMPELCLVYFRVEVDGRKLYGQNCIPLVSLRQGIKYIPLRTTGGELIPESGLFVRIKLTEDIWRPPSRSPKHLAKNTSLTAKEALETISEVDDMVDVTASLNPVFLTKYLPRQSQEVDENPLSDEDQSSEDNEESRHSFARRTLSSPPSITADRANVMMMRKTPSPENKIEVEINTVPEKDSIETSSIQSNRARSITLLPNLDTAPLDEDSSEASSHGAQKEFTLQVQVDVEDKQLSWF